MANRGVVVGNEPVGDVGADGGLVVVDHVHRDGDRPGEAEGGAGHLGPAPRLLPPLVVVVVRTLRPENSPESLK